MFLLDFKKINKKMKALVSAHRGHSSLNMEALRVFSGILSDPFTSPTRFIHMRYLVKEDVLAGFFLQA